MIREFALEPEMVANWGDRKTCRYYKEQFGLGTGRIVSRFPNKWRKEVMRRFNDSNEDTASLSAEEAARIQARQHRLVELLSRLTEVMVLRRGYSWDPESTWIENALVDHLRVPFDAIVVHKNDQRLSELVAEHDCEHDHDVWLAPRSQVVRREAADLAGCVCSMLRSCSEVVFVDPHFGPENSRYLATMRAFLGAVFGHRQGELPSKVEIHSGSRATPDFFRDECLGKLRGSIPSEATVRVWHLRERQGGQQFHNRYILTNLGGVSFGAGLDLVSGRHQATDDAQILDKGAFLVRWNQHSTPDQTFEPKAAPIDVAGTRPV